MNSLYQKIKQLLINVFSALVYLNLYFLNKESKRIYYFDSLGFGDCISYCLAHYTKINKDKKGYALNFGFITNGPIKFFFKKKKIINLFFYIHKFMPHYGIVSKIQNYNQFKPIKKYGYTRVNNFKNKDSLKNLLIVKLKQTEINQTFNPNKIFGNKYVCVSIKSFVNNNHFMGAGPRATFNLDPINKIIEYLTQNGLNICVLGLNNDFSIQDQKKKFKDNKKVKFLNDHSIKYSFESQLSVCLKSSGYLGTAHGISNLYYIAQKKNIFFNCPNDKFSYLYPDNLKRDKEYNKYLFKKIKTDKGYLDFNYDLIEKVKNKSIKITNQQVLENSFDEIRTAVDYYLNNKFW